MVFVESLNYSTKSVSANFTSFIIIYVLKSWQIDISVNMFGENTTETMMHIF